MKDIACVFFILGWIAIALYIVLDSTGGDDNEW
jgi:hypothetical protein